MNQIFEPPGTSDLTASQRRKPKVAIFATNVSGIYSGGRYLSLIMGYALAQAGARVAYYTNLVPAFNGDFEDLDHAFHLDIIEEEDWPIDGDPTADWVIVVPTGSQADGFYAKAKRFAKHSNAHLALLSFETPNWFNALVETGKSALPWEGWANVVADGGLVLTIAEEGLSHARSFYGALLPEADLRFDYWHPAINDMAADAIGWADVPVFPNRIACFIRTSDPHKGSLDLLGFPVEFFNDKTLCLIFGTGIDRDYLERLHAHTAQASGCRILAFEKVSDKEKLALLASSAVLLYPTQFEGFGYPPVEAAHVGTPTVAYDLPVLRETLGESGRFVPVGDTLALAAAAHNLAAQPSSFRRSLDIPAQCACRIAGEALVDKLAKAERHLAPMSLRKAATLELSPQSWLPLESCWSTLRAFRGPDGLLYLQGHIGSRGANGPLFLRVEEIDASALGTCAGPDGMAFVHCALNDSLLLTAGIIRVQVEARKRVIAKWDIPIYVAPALRLCRDLVQGSTSPRAIHVRLVESEFGGTLLDQLGLKALLGEIAILGYDAVLVADQATIERLAQVDELAGMVTATMPPDEAASAPAPIAQISLDIAHQPDAPFVSAVLTHGAIRYTVNRAAPLLGVRRTQDADFAVSFLLDARRSRRICLVNAGDELGVTAEAFECAAAILERLGAAYVDEIVFAVSSMASQPLDEADRLGLSRMTIISEHDLLAEPASEQTVVIDCGAAPLGSQTGLTMPANGLSLSDFASVDAAVTAACQKIDAIDAGVRTSGVLQSLLPARLAHEYAVTAPALRHRTRAQRKYSSAADMPGESPPERPWAPNEALFTPASRAFPLARLVRGGSYRSLPNYLEFRSNVAAVLEFATQAGSAELTFDAVLMVRTKVTANLAITITLDDQPAVKRTVRSNRFERISALFADINEHDLHRVEIALVEAQNATIRVRAASILTGATAGEADAEPTEQHEAAQQQMLFPRIAAPAPAKPDFAIAMREAGSLAVCGKGFDLIERAYRWTVGYVAELYMACHAGFDGDLTLTLTASALLDATATSADMILQINGERIGTMTFGRTPDRQSITITREVARRGFDALQLIIPEPLTPASLGLNNDRRELGFCIYEVAMVSSPNIDAPQASMADTADRTPRTAEQDA